MPPNPPSNAPLADRLATSGSDQEDGASSRAFANRSAKRLVAAGLWFYVVMLSVSAFGSVVPRPSPAVRNLIAVISGVALLLLPYAGLMAWRMTRARRWPAVLAFVAAAIMVVPMLNITMLGFAVVSVIFVAKPESTVSTSQR